MKSLKKNFVLCFSCLLIFLLGALSINFSINKVAAETISLEGLGTQESPYLIKSREDFVFFQQLINSEESEKNYLTANYVLEVSLNLSDIVNWAPIGTETRPFSGTFNGNGKVVEGINLTETSLVLGLFGNVKNATILNLGVSVNVVLSETQEEQAFLPNQKIIAGGIAGVAENSTIKASYAKFSLKANRIVRMEEARAQEFYQKIEGSEEITGVNVTTYQYQTFLYKGEVVCGGLVGQLLNSTLTNCYSIPEITLFQEGSNIVNTYIGGAAGYVDNGEVLNVYVAPTDELVSAIVSKNGNLTAVESKHAPIKINSSKESLSQVVFGGIIGFGMGGNLTVYNTIFSSFVASLSPTKIDRGGIIGKISDNSSLFPLDVQYHKFLSLPNVSSNVLYISNGIGNATAVGFVVNSNVSAISAIPTLNSFNSWAWNELRPWDFENTWKNTSIITPLGFYFPALQNFASFTITVSGNKEVSYTVSNSYLSGYYTLELEGRNTKTYQYSAGQEVKIIAKFYSEEGNPLRDFKNYFTFTNWLLGGYSVSEIDYSKTQSANGYTASMDPQSGTTTLSFVASSQTEGTYDVNILGRPVTVNVEMYNSETEQHQANIGVITKKSGNLVESHVNNFSFVVNEYLNGVATTLTADNSSSGEYIFSNKWQDLNQKSQTTATKTVVVELNNERRSSSSRFYPTVVSTENGLVATVVAYFSNNTSVLNVAIKGDGQIKINNGNLISTNVSQNLINGSNVVLQAIPKDGMEFVGWFAGGELVSDAELYEHVFNSGGTIEARFQRSPKNGSGLAAWAIALIVLIPVVVISVIVIVVVKIKRKSTRSYKKNYRL